MDQCMCSTQSIFQSWVCTHFASHSSYKLTSWQVSNCPSQSPSGGMIPQWQWATSTFTAWSSHNTLSVSWSIWYVIGYIHIWAWVDKPRPLPTRKVIMNLLWSHILYHISQTTTTAQTTMHEHPTVFAAVTHACVLCNGYKLQYMISNKVLAHVLCNKQLL